MTAAEVLAPVAPSSATARRRIAVLWFIGLIVLLAALLSLIRGAVDDPPQTGPSGSSYATTEGGVGALAELATVNGFAVVRLTTAPSDAEELEWFVPTVGRDVLVVLGSELDDDDRESVLAWVERGGRLVADVSGGAPWLLDDYSQLDWRGSFASDAPVDARVVRGAAGDARSLAVAGTGTFAGVFGDALAVRKIDNVDGVEGVDGKVATRFAAGAGEIVALADSSPLSNSLLGEADNAGFALALFSGRDRILFAEHGHGYGSNALTPTGLPWRGRWFAFGLVFATLLLMWSRSKRLGRAEPPERELAPPRSDYLASMVQALDDQNRTSRFRSSRRRTHRNAESPTEPMPEPTEPRTRTLP